MDVAQPLWISVTVLDCPYREKASLYIPFQPLLFQPMLVFLSSSCMPCCEELGSIFWIRVEEGCSSAVGSSRNLFFFQAEQAHFPKPLLMEHCSNPSHSGSHRLNSLLFCTGAQNQTQGLDVVYQDPSIGLGDNPLGARQITFWKGQPIAQTNKYQEELLEKEERDNQKL